MVCYRAYRPLVSHTDQFLVLSKGIESPDAYGALRSLRDVRHIRLQKELFLKDKDARLRSGARGMQARKALIAMEKEVAAYKSM